MLLAVILIHTKSIAQAPANDLICNAIQITCGSASSGTTNAATNAGTNENFVTCGGYAQNTPAVWYYFVGTGDIVTFSLCSSAAYTDTELGIYSGLDCNSASCLAANDDNGPSCANLQSSIAIPTTVGTVYFVKVFSWNTFTPNFTFTLTVACAVPPTPPGNDFICNATPIACGASLTGTTVGATVGGQGEPGTCPGGYGQNTPGVWYTIVGNGSVMTASLCNTSPSVDSQLAVFTGNCSSPTCLTAVDDYGPSCASLQASVSFQTTAGVTYYIRVWRYSWFYNPNGTITTFNIDLTCSFTGPPNDPCAGATLVGVPYNSGLVSVAQATSASDGTVPTYSSCGNSTLNLNNTLWYAVEGDGTTYTASTISNTTNFDTEIQVFSGACGSLTSVACNNLTSGVCTNNISEDVTWCTTLGVMYYVLIGSETLNCANSNFVLAINSTAVPAAATLYNNDMIWRGGSGSPAAQTGSTFSADSGQDWTIPSNWYIYDSINDNFVASITTLPTTNTNVFIPKLGGCTTKLPMIWDTKSAYAKNLTIMKGSRLWFGQTTSTALQVGSLEIKGDLLISGQLIGGVGSNTSATTNKATGLVKFTGTNNQTITYAELSTASPFPPVYGTVNLYNLEINNTGTNTGLVLNSPIYVLNDLKMTQGNILTTYTNHFVLGITGAGALIASSSYPACTPQVLGTTVAPAVATVNWTNGSVVGPMYRYQKTIVPSTAQNSLFPVGGLSNGNIVNRNASLYWATTGTSVGLLRAQYIPGTVTSNPLPMADGAVTLVTVAAEGYWELHPYQNLVGPGTPYANNFPTAAPAYNLSLRANQYASLAANYTNARIIKSPTQGPIAWQPNGTHGTITGNSTDFTITRTGMLAFSYFAVAIPQLPLAAEFIGANWECMDNYVDFRWATASEHNSANFLLETSDDGYTWNTYAEVQAAGNSTEQLEYRYSLNKTGSDVSYVRLSEIDQDGTLSELGVFGINCSEGGHLYTYPNPSENGFYLNINDKELIGRVKIEMRDSKGSKIIEESSLEVKEGTNSYYINTDGLAPGMYYIKVSNEAQSVIVKHSLR